EPAEAAARRRGDPDASAGLLPRRGDGRRPRQLRRGAVPRPAGARQRADPQVGAVTTAPPTASNTVLQGMERGTLAPDGVGTMFDRIAPVYDAMNRVMTAGLDQRWRRLTVRAVAKPGDRVLDACCGTGDLAVAAARAGATVTGLDFSPRMLERARRKLHSVT